MPDIAIRVEQLGKRYRLGETQMYRSLRDSLMNIMRGSFMTSKRAPYFWALKDVSLEIPAGQVVGLIGRNGAGKSTLLKILARITDPTHGHARIRGRIGSLLEVGTGFHPELSGRENIYLSGAILGMRKKEIDRKFDAIVDFAEMGQFVDTPVKHYSSGMYVRLAFAVAAHLEPEILLVDEVLAVGDAAFQKKCLGKMDDIAGSGRTVVFVTHNMAAIENLCTSAYLLNRGRVLESGNVGAIISRYLKDVNSLEYEPLSERKDREGNGKLRFEYFRVSSGNGNDAAVFGARTHIEIAYNGTAPLRNVHIAVGIFSQFGQGTLYLSNELTGNTFQEVPAHGVFQCEFDKFPLLSGVYTVNLFCSINGIVADWVKDAARLNVEAGDFYGSGRAVPAGYGSVAVPHDWKFVAK